MKKITLSVLFVPLAVLGWILRRTVYTAAVDEKNLIISGHPALIALWILTIAALALAVFGGWKQKDLTENDTNTFAFLGHGMLAVGMLLDVFGNPLSAPGILGLLWKLLAVVSPVCLLLAGFSQLREKKPFFALYAAPALFFLIHIVGHYQIWCANPQFTDYAFALLGSVMLVLHSYQLAACALEEGKQPVRVFTGLAAVYLCVAAMPCSAYPYLYLGGALFCLTSTRG